MNIEEHTRDIDGVLSFNIEPIVAGAIQEHLLTTRDSVVLRQGLGQVNDKIVAAISEKIGSGPFQVVRLGSRKTLIETASGTRAWVSRLFLKPAAECAAAR